MRPCSENASGGSSTAIRSISFGEAPISSRCRPPSATATPPNRLSGAFSKASFTCIMLTASSSTNPLSGMYGRMLALNSTSIAFPPPCRINALSEKRNATTQPETIVTGLFPALLCSPPCRSPHVRPTASANPGARCRNWDVARLFGAIHGAARYSICDIPETLIFARFYLSIERPRASFELCVGANDVRQREAVARRADRA
jgi:hypothetical protein